MNVVCLSRHSYWRIFTYLYSRLWLWIYPVPDLLCGNTSSFFRESRVHWPPPHVPDPPLPAFSTPPLLLSPGVVQPLQRRAQKRERSRGGVDGCLRAEEEQRREGERKKPFLLGHLWSKCISGERGRQTKRLSRGGKAKISLQALRAWDEEKRREEKIGEETTRSKYGEREFKRIVIQCKFLDFCKQPNQFEGISFKWILESRGVCGCSLLHICSFSCF